MPITTDIQRAKAREAIRMFTADGSIGRVLQKLSLAGKDFYRALGSDSKLQADYEEAKRIRAEIMTGEAYEIGTDSEIDPRRARVQAEIRMKLATMFSPDLYSDRLQVNMRQTVDITHDVQRKFLAIVQSGYDLIGAPKVQDAEYTMLPAPSPTDQASDAPLPSYESVFDD